MTRVWLWLLLQGGTSSVDHGHVCVREYASWYRVFLVVLPVWVRGLGVCGGVGWESVCMVWVWLSGMLLGYETATGGCVFLPSWLSQASSCEGVCGGGVWLLFVN